MITTPAFFHSDIAKTGVVHYLSKLMEKMREPACPTTETGDTREVADAVFAALTSRKFCYLSKRRVAPYYEATLAALEADIEAGRPVQIYYDIGGGYHASLDPNGKGDLRFSVGLGELCILSQIAAFHRLVSGIYAPGVEFHLVIDDICALLVNDVPLASTGEYRRTLRTLLDATVLDAPVHMLVESEHFDAADYTLPPLESALGELKPEPCARDLENVARFLGRLCDPEEARERMAKYLLVSRVSEEKIGSLVHGLRMTQRATSGTLAFRPFAGADSRIQAGEVALIPTSRGGVRPFLLTSRNAAEHQRVTVDCSRLIPRPIERVTLAAKVTP